MALEYQHPVEWEDVFDSWRRDEAVQPGWQECAKKKGWPDWESWRLNMAGQLALEKRDWHLFRVFQPMEVLPQMVVGPFQSWQRHLPPEKRNKVTFAEYLDIESSRLVQNHKIMEIIRRFPVRTQLIGLADLDKKRVICLEGTHRSIAVAASRKHGFALPYQLEVRLALAKLQDGDWAIFDQMSNRGSENPETAVTL